MAGYELKNMEAFSGAASTAESTILLPRQVKEVLLINDGAANLLFRFSTSNSAGILKTNEDITLNIQQNQILLSTQSGTANYRILAFY